MSAPSEDYFRAIAEGAEHHAGSKTYSGSLLRPHKPFLSDMIARLGCTSAVDVGCGKGTQYQWIDPADGKTLEQAWGFDVQKFDPCWPPFAAEPIGQFDLAICTHTMSLIPQADLEWFTRKLFRYATKGVFVAEKIGDRKKADVTDPEQRAINWTRAQWVSWIALMADEFSDLPEVVLSTRERLDRGNITTRHIWRSGRFVETIEAKPRGEQE